MPNAGVKKKYFFLCMKRKIIKSIYRYSIIRKIISIKNTTHILSLNRENILLCKRYYFLDTE